MINAHEQRLRWREMLKAGDMPKEVLYFIIEHFKRSNDPTFRASTYLEVLGEVAIVWYEEKYGKIPDN